MTRATSALTRKASPWREPCQTRLAPRAWNMDLMASRALQLHQVLRVLSGLRTSRRMVSGWTWLFLFVKLACPPGGIRGSLLCDVTRDTFECLPAYSSE